ncbi:hypothetical protein VB712_00025 [Spirulina sp. CCNP1310]|uniref:hypothetical protein n=1 Tax=Spirulina sp. CCNP1310 TaxID=3110249 RepID=UPI002B20B33B|nr:hypothetical protein [Spirulina sp. CCNP1310]MEA5417587.1 hypothetical protein [Spirulina sp. CCNP1310]
MDHAPCLVYPALNLFLYDGRDSTNEGQRDGYANADRQALGNKQPKRLRPPQNGYLYQRIFPDAYALQINGMDSEDAEWTYQAKPIDCFAGIKAQLITESAIAPGEWGRSWLLVGRLAAADQNPEYVAKDCYHALALTSEPDWSKDLIGQGRLMGASFFELWRPPGGDECAMTHGCMITDHKNYFHLYICLFDPGASLKRLDKLYHHLLTLGLYRHRATWAHCRTLDLKTTLNNYGQEVEKICHQVNQQVHQENLSHQHLTHLLRHSLILLSQYGAALHQFNTHIHTLEGDLQSYQDRCRLVAKLNHSHSLNPHEPDDSQYLERFKNFAIRRYLRPMQRDYHQLSPGLRQLEDALRVMTGLLQIEQSRQQQALERAVVATSLGLGTTTVVGTVLAPPLLLPRSGGLPGEIALPLLIFLSALAGLGVARFMWHQLPKS